MYKEKNTKVIMSLLQINLRDDIAEKKKWGRSTYSLPRVFSMCKLFLFINLQTIVIVHSEHCAAIH